MAQDINRIRPKFFCDRSGLIFFVNTCTSLFPDLPVSRLKPSLRANAKVNDTNVFTKAMTFPVLFVPTTTLRLPQKFRSPSLSPSRRASPCLSAGPPPKVKSSYYKNPSKAIEKGGGFYIPGLRGPRLRVAVPILALVLLTINHITTGPGLAVRSFQVSETLAAAAAFSVLATALLDISAEREDAAADVASQRNIVAAAQSTPNQEASAEPSSQSLGDFADELIWAEAVCADLTGATAFAVCRDGTIVHASGLAITGGQAGTAVDRVAKEKRAVYIDDTTALPPEVTLPFLPNGAWAVFLVPQQEQVIALAKEKGQGFDKRQRDWLTQMAVRIGRGCQ